MWFSKYVCVFVYLVLFSRGPRQRSFAADYHRSEEYVNLYDTTYLTALQKKEPTEIVIILEARLETLIQVLNNCKIMKDVRKSVLILKIIDKTLCCDSMPNTLQVIYTAIFQEEFIQFVVFEFMTNFNRVEITESVVQETTEHLISICTRSIELFSDSLSTILGFYELLLQLVSSFHSLKENWNTLNTSKIYKTFTILTETKCSLLRHWIKPCVPETACNRTSTESKDFRKISIIPKPCRSYILAEPSQCLQKNKTDGAYADLDQYLDIQFRLLREDFMTPLRRGMVQYLDTTSVNDREQRNPYIRVYKGVSIRPPACKKELIFTVQFDVTKLKRINWEHSKRLIHGALICLSQDNFKTLLFGTIAERDPFALKCGKTRVKFENGIKNIDTTANIRYTMLETNALFEAYRHVLLALQRTREEVPFKNYFLKCQSEIEPPRYLRRENHITFDLSPLVQKSDVLFGENKLGILDENRQTTKQSNKQEQADFAKGIDILELKCWPSHERLNLDKSQFKALQTALTKEFAIIQGPPGTGKTYVGLQIVKVLLKNKKAWSFRMNECYEQDTQSTKATKNLFERWFDLLTDRDKPILNILNRQNEDIDPSLKPIAYKNEAIQKTLNTAFKIAPENQSAESTSGLALMNSPMVPIKNDADFQNKRSNATCEFVYDPRPILIVCYTNHALDQFLEGIDRFYKGDILRIGGRSKSERMAKHNLHVIRKEITFSKCLIKTARDSNRDIYDLKRNISLSAVEMDSLKENVIHAHCLIPPTDIAIFQLEEYCLLRSIADKDYYINRGYTKLFDISTTVIWLRLFEKLNEIARVRGRSGNIFACNFHDGKAQNHERLVDKETRLYDMSNESNDFVEAVRADVSDIIALSLENVQSQNIVCGIKTEFLGYLRAQLMSTDIMSDEEEEYFANDIISLSTNNRWRLYRKWVDHRCKELEQETKLDLVKIENACFRRSELELQKDKKVMQNATIIGMTTTCAAKYHAILNEVKPRIVIIEEAAEVFETHIIACLNSACDQIILIGDHKQLRPTPATYELAAKYHLDVSLFERMVDNGIHCDCLQIQHRMRPMISKVVRKIYPDLIDHETVESYDNIGGIAENMYFVSHDHDEFYNEEQKSYSNQHEAMFVIALSRYIIQQGYKPSKITILTTYKGQLFLLKNLLKKENFCHQNLVVTVVDNYQGEENDIVILSLVRSNKEGKTGFLTKANRICVALSRAKKGLYMIGNISKLAKASSLWKYILTDLTKDKLIGDSLPLYCQNHSEEKVFASSYEDFKLAPEGGCQKTCDYRLNCGHVCEKKCHVLDSGHQNIICRKPCIRKCKNGHRCIKRCNETCGKCTVKIIETLKCGHIKAVACHVDLEHYNCDSVCNKQLECGHTCQKQCAENCYPCQSTSNASLLKCKHEIELVCGSSHIPVCERSCERKLQCGHICKCTCGLNGIWDLETEHKVKCSLGHGTICEERCDSILVCKHKCIGNCTDCFGTRLHNPCSKRCNCDLACGHKCEGLCKDCFPCERRCEVSCPHGRCFKTCKEPCQKCENPCAWECQHFKCTALCGELCNRPRCSKPCKQELKCGHVCIGLCGERCPTECFDCNRSSLKSIGIFKSEKQTTRGVELEDCGHLVEYKQMDAYMDKKETPIRLKRCHVCTTPIRRSLRYGNVIKEILLKVEELKNDATKAFVLHDDLMRFIESWNIHSIKTTLETVDDYFSSERESRGLFELVSYKPFLNKIVSSEMDTELVTPISCLNWHQTVSDTALEIKRYFDKNILRMLQSKLYCIQRELSSDIKSYIKRAAQIIDLKKRYDSESQTAVEECFIKLNNSLSAVKAIILEIHISPVADKDTIINYSDGMISQPLLSRSLSRKTDSVNVEMTQLNDPKVIHLHLFIQKQSPYYNCGKLHDCTFLSGFVFTLY